MSSAIRNDSVPVLLGRVFLREASTGVDTDVTASFSALYSEGQRFCIAVVQAAYSIVHLSDSASSILSATVDLVVANISLPAEASVVRTRTSVLFASNGSASVSQALGNLVPRARSGNPGYIIGEPVLFGTLISDAAASKTAVLQTVRGASVPSPLLLVATSEPRFECASHRSSAARR